METPDIISNRNPIIRHLRKEGILWKIGLNG